MKNCWKRLWVCWAIEKLWVCWRNCWTRLCACWKNCWKSVTKCSNTLGSVVKSVERTMGLLKQFLKNDLDCGEKRFQTILVCWKTVGNGFSQFRNCLKRFGSVEKAVEKLWVCWNNHLKELWVCWKSYWNSFESVEKLVERALGFLIFQKALSRLEKQSKTLWAFRKTIENNLCLWKTVGNILGLLQSCWKSFGSDEKLNILLFENCWENFRSVENCRKHFWGVGKLLKELWVCWKSFGSVEKLLTKLWIC